MAVKPDLVGSLLTIGIATGIGLALSMRRSAPAQAELKGHIAS
jgi:hypothetical protein